MPATLSKFLVASLAAMALAQDSENIAGLKSDQESAFKRLSRTKKECGECQKAEDALIKAYGVAMKAHTVYEKIEGFVLDINAKQAAMLAIKLDKQPLEDALAGISTQVDGFGCDNLEGDDFSVPEAVAMEAAKVDNALKEYKRAEQALNEAKDASAKDEVCGGSACDDTTLETAKKAALASDGEVKANEGGVATACKNIDLDDKTMTVKAQSLPLPTHIARAAKLKTMMADIDAKLAALN
jgi:hypothetical protein